MHDRDEPNHPAERNHRTEPNYADEPSEAAEPRKPTKDDVARQFGRMAEAYATSPTHARGEDLEILLRLLDARPDETVLDVATGAGHTACAVAPHARQVVATDLTHPMGLQAQRLAATRGLANLRVAVSDGERLAFRSGSFDAVTCRVAPHHFLDVPRFLEETARVLRPGGRFVLEDSCVPDDPELDRFVNDVERLRDPTHVRAYTKREWRSMVAAAGLAIEHAEIWRKRHDMDDWISRAGVTREVDLSVRRAFADAPAETRRRLSVVASGGLATSWTDEKLLLRARKPAAH
jgi:ubiquinone/menaquinone biosynthesis C-methylase UbiE